MNKNSIGRVSTGECETDWERFDALTEEDIRKGIEDDPEIVPTDAEFWKSAKLVPPKITGPYTIRLEQDPPSRHPRHAKRRA